MEEKKKYYSPSITVYGTVEEITGGGNATNADAEGDPNTAYSA